MFIGFLGHIYPYGIYILTNDNFVNVYLLLNLLYICYKVISQGTSKVLVSCKYEPFQHSLKKTIVNISEKVYVINVYRCVH